MKKDISFIQTIWEKQNKNIPPQKKKKEQKQNYFIHVAVLRYSGYLCELSKLNRVKSLMVQSSFLPQNNLIANPVYCSIIWCKYL